MFNVIEIENISTKNKMYLNNMVDFNFVFDIPIL